MQRDGPSSAEFDGVGPRERQPGLHRNTITNTGFAGNGYYGSNAGHNRGSIRRAGVQSIDETGGGPRVRLRRKRLMGILPQVNLRGWHEPVTACLSGFGGDSPAGR